MATLLSLGEPRLLTAAEFLQIDFGPDLKAELDNGVIRMMAGGSRDHARIQANMLIALGTRLRGTGCRPYGSDMAILTHDASVRYPDVTVDCGQPGDSGADRYLSAPRIIVEILSPSTRTLDLGSKKAEYQALPSVEAIVFVDPDAETLVVSTRSETGWSDSLPARRDVDLPTLNLTIPHAEIFARD
ncbi:Uma2 family endonuclease [Sphingomonas endophytica]|uniref:Uma2 family endonuclease n=1 Tax=Sphingomonas endophytica TaxID=869719 RepID=A0A7X0J9L2_9SPHN|nr:Uma2 family endonuclease [Sphingomonas endophytica]MBB6503593.1 Uma2 family endonuclease [Sphingomonas endophytica]